MEYTKDYLTKKFLNPLFFDKDGNRILKEIQTHIDAQNLSLNKILTEFEHIFNLHDPNFWTKIVSIINSCFNSNMDITKYNLNKEDEFKSFVHELLRIKFDFIFECDESKKINDQKLLNEYINTLLQNNDVILIASQDNIKRLIVPSKKEYSINALPNEPKTLFSFPNILIKIDKQRISFNCSNKARLSSIIKKIQSVSKEGEQTILGEFNEETIDNLKVDVKNFFTNLKEEGFFIKTIRFRSPLFYFSAGSKEVLDYEKLVDANYYLNTILDFINIQQIKMVFNQNVGNKSKDFVVTIKIICHEISEEAGNIKFNIIISKNKALTTKIEKEIFNKLKAIGIVADCSYELPLEHYLNKFLYLDGNINRLYKKILSLDKDNKILNELIKNQIVSNGEEIKINNDKLNEFILASFKKLIKKSFSSNNEEFTISDVIVDDKKRIILNIKLSNDNLLKNEYYQVIVHNDVRGYDRIIKIALYNFDKAYFLKSILEKNNEKVLAYLYNRIWCYLNYEYNLQLEKEAKSAHSWLKEYSSNFKNLEKNKTPAQLGGIVEKKLNILLKYLYRNYLLIGGPKKPDGYLYQNKTDTYLMDSKQHKDIYIGEIDKIVRYLFSFCKKAQLPESNNGVLIICREKLGKTLNKKARDEWKNSKEYNQKYKVAFVSLEFLLELFELVRKPVVNANNQLKKKIQDAFYEVIKQSADFSDKKTLTDLEDKTIAGLQKEIQREDYIPQESKEL